VSAAPLIRYPRGSGVLLIDVDLWLKKGETEHRRSISTATEVSLTMPKSKYSISNVADATSYIQE
jgi:hypothetical protein